MTTVSLTISEVFDIALRSYYAGKLGETERMCLKILSADPDSAATLNLLAVVHASLGRNDAALACYDRALALQPDSLPTLNNRGAVLKQLGRYGEALDSYDRALALEPERVEVLNNRAGVLQELARHGEALAGYDHALALQPDYPEALNNRGVTLQALGRHAEALTSYSAALALRPDFVEAMVNRGLAFCALDRFDDALADYDHALALRPDHADALSNRGNALNSLQRLQDALDSYDGALALQPQRVETLYNRGVVLHKLGRLEEALASYDNAIAVDPDCTAALANRGATLHELGRFDEALDSLARALALQPDNAEALTSRGVVLHDLARQDRGGTLQKREKLEDALAGHDAALAARPGYAEAHANRGAILYDLKRFDQALASYDQAIAARPDYADAHFLRSLARLVTGDFARGWTDYEWRHTAPAARLPARAFRQPLWRGEDDIAGKTILLHSEQGFGDSIQFCRYVPLVAARGARVVLEVERPLCTLMAGLAGAPQIIAKGDALPDFDLHCPLPSLPLAFKTRLETIPAGVPYLQAGSRAQERWSARLGSERAPRIGLAWAGNSKHVRDRERSMALRDLQPLLECEATFVSLQKDVRAADAELLAASRMLRLDRELGDFSDTAALIAQLDLVIAVDTSVAHLAGALSKPVWILLTHAPDWRWLPDRDDSLWYPTARLFRQHETRDWAGVVLRVREALGELTGHRR